MPNALSEEQRFLFDTKGYLIVPDVLTSDEIEALKNANNTLIAQGEAVVVGERYGVRITEIVSLLERVKRLGGGEGE